MAKMTDEEKAAKAEAKAFEKAQKAAKKIANDKLKAAKAKAQEQGLDTIECICKNVHIGGGVKLTATQNQHGNWVDGDVAQVSHADAVFMERNGQVKIL